MDPHIRRLAVVAHFDATLLLGEHVRRLLRELLTVCERVVVVSTSGVDVPGREWLEGQPEITYLERPNAGYDFKSMQVGFLELGAVGAAEVLFCNDSFVGPFVPLEQMFRAMEHRDVDFWGMTKSFEIREHVQSYFMVYRPQVVRRRVFQEFWRDFGMPKSRDEAIEAGELELSARLADAGFRGGAYFEPTEEDVVTANQRYAYLTLPENQPSAALENHFEKAWRVRVRSDQRMYFNSTVLLADRALDGTLPIFKLEVARTDPAELNALLLRRELADDHPLWFEGVDAFIRRTEHLYRARYSPRGLPREVPRAFEVVQYRRPQEHRPRARAGATA